MTAVLAIIRNVIQSERRDRTALIFTMLLPIFLMGLFGTIFSSNGVSLSIGVVDHDRSALSSAFLSALRAQKGLDIEVGTQAHELDRLKHDDIVVLAVIPRGFQAALKSSSQAPAAIDTYLDQNQLQSASLAQGVLAQLLQGFAEQASGQHARAVLRVRNVETANVTTLDFYLPSMIAYIVLLVGLQSVAISLVDLRERRVLRRFQATPLSSLQILGGQIVGRSVIVVLQVILLIIVGLFLFKAHSHGSWLLAWLSILVGIACFVAIGFLVTGFARTSEAARGISSAITFPMMFLSGVFVPLNVLPSGLQDAVHVLPLTYLTDALHHVMNDGDGFSAIWVDLVVMAAWTVVCFGVAARRFKWE